MPSPSPCRGLADDGDRRKLCHFVLFGTIAAVERVIDTTGAGDLFAAGFLFGLTHGMGPAESTRLGSLCAAEVISHTGARPETDLRALAAGAGLLAG